MNLRVLLMCLTLAICALPVCAQDSSGLTLMQKLMGADAPWRNHNAPAGVATAPTMAPQFPPPSNKRKDVAGSCEAAESTLCYDYRSGSSVYKPSRLLMPEISGMRRENLVVRRDKITFKYSFQ
jgi:hypothetical protein